MKKLTSVFILILLLAATPGVVHANSYDGALANFYAGDFDRAVAEGRSLETSAGYTVALRAQLVLIQYLYQPNLRMEAIERALADGEKALLLDPENFEAKLNLGIIFGLRGKYNRSIKDGLRSYDLLLEAVNAQPENDWMLGAMGGWHAEIIFEAGRIPGRLIFGAKRKKAMEYFEAAIEYGPDNLTIRAAYIRALLKLFPEAMKTVIDENMSFILIATPANALEMIMQRQIKQIKAAIDAGDQKTLALYLDEEMALAEE